MANLSQIPTMSDQADQLRILVQTATEEDVSTATPPIVAIAGGRRGVGVTTAAIQLGVALRRMDFRVILMDADLENPTVMNRCQVTGESTIAEVLTGRRTVQEALVQGPVGIQVLPGKEPLADWHMSAASQYRFLAGLKRMGSTADIILLDCGMCPGNLRIGQVSDLVLLVTTTEPDAVMDAYAAIKSLDQSLREPALSIPATNASQSQVPESPELSSPPTLPPIATLVRDTNDPSMALNVHHRLASACQRFLGIELRAAPSIHAPHGPGSPWHAAKPRCKDTRPTWNSCHCLAEFVAMIVGLIDPCRYRASA